MYAVTIALTSSCLNAVSERFLVLYSCHSTYSGCFLTDNQPSIGKQLCHFNKDLTRCVLFNKLVGN